MVLSDFLTVIGFKALNIDEVELDTHSHTVSVQYMSA